jgi:hypothetical protein
VHVLDARDVDVGGSDLGERREHRLDVALAPRRRPVRGHQVLEDEQRRLAVLEREQPRRERHVAERGEDPVLVADPARARVGRPRLQEGLRAVGEADRPVLVQRPPLAPDRRPRLGRRAEERLGAGDRGRRHGRCGSTNTRPASSRIRTDAP